MDSIVRDALASVAQAKAPRVLTWPPRPWSAKPAPRIRPRSTYDIHDHPFAELCIAVRGRARMHLAGHWFAFEPPALAMIDRKVMHTEGRRSKRESYCLVWMSFHRAALIGHASAYVPGRGRFCPGRVRLHGLLVQQLRRWFERARDDHGERWMRLQSVVMQVLTQMHEQLVHEAVGEPRRSTIDPREAVVRWVREHLDEHYADPMDLKTLATLTGYTPNHLNALFQEATGQPIHSYLITRRLECAWCLCRQTAEPIHAIARR